MAKARPHKPAAVSRARICRICETSEGQLEMLRDFGRFSLISDLYPFSQYVPPIFEKIAISELTQESHAEFWEKAHNRSFGNSVNHDPRFCSCRFCSQDRETLRQAIQPLLTGDESEIIDVCYRLRPEVERVIGESQAKAGEQLARLAGLNEEQMNVPEPVAEYQEPEQVEADAGADAVRPETLDAAGTETEIVTELRGKNRGAKGRPGDRRPQGGVDDH